MAVITSSTWVVYWIFLPITLVSSVIFRYNLLSGVYLILLLGLPFTPQLRPDKIGSWAGFALATALLSGLFLLGHICFQIVLLVMSPYGSILGDYCSRVESIARYVGFQRLDHEDVGNILRLLLPDVAVFLLGIGTYILIRKTSAYFARQEQSAVSEPKSLSVVLKNATILCVNMIFMALAGIALPSVVSSVYLLTFMMFAFLWACQVSLLTSLLASFRAMVSAVTFLQLLALFIYQFNFAQDFVPPDSLAARLIGLTAIIRTDCDATYKLLLFPTLPWTEFVSPACIFLLHWSLAVGCRMYYQDSHVLQQQQSSLLPSSGGILSSRTKKDERKPLVAGEETPHNYEAIQASHPSERPGTSKQRHNGPKQAASQTDGPSANKGILVQISKWLSEIKQFSFYVVALVVMMLWSVTYHSWLTFVLLMWSCVLWLTKARARYTLYSSPLLALYGSCLVLLQFIYSLNLKESELPTVINETDGQILYLSAFGLRRYDYPCLHLGAQILYLCGFWLVLHQFMFIRRLGQASSESQTRNESSLMENFASCVKEFLSKYWIFVVIGFHLAVGTEGYPDGMKLIYMFFFLLNTFTYIVSWRVWRKTLTLYWTVLVAYSMLVLALIYTYQFKEFPNYWRSLTNFSDAKLNDLGLEQAETSGQLLGMVLIPGLFLLVVIFQLHYFNKRFLEVTDRPVVVAHSLSNATDQSHESRNGDEYEMNELSGGTTIMQDKDSKNWFLQKFHEWSPLLLKAWGAFMSFFMRAMEFHIWALVFVTVYAAAAHQVTAFYAIFVVFWVLLLPLRKLHSPLFIMTSSAASLLILAIMFYQLRFISEDANLVYNCTDGNETGKYHLTDWIGVGKMSKTGTGFTSSFFYHVEGYIAIVLMIALERTVARRQSWRRLWHQEPPPVVTAFYPSITWREVDRGIIDCAKYFINYFFYKFGVETCFVMSVITVWTRMDLLSPVYCILLIIPLLLHRRAAVFRYWSFYVIMLMILLLWVYFASLGIPPVWCSDHNYPWDHIMENKTIRDRLLLWLYLPDYFLVKDSTTSIADFFQLLFVICQLYVFRRESNIGLKYGGDNKYLTGVDLDRVTLSTNPKKNFMLKGSRSILDQIKVFIFKYTIWITMSIIFLAGTSRISMFTLGYLVFFFYLLAKQQSLVLGRPSRLVKLVNILLGYTVSVITLKASLQIASCVFIDTLVNKACWFVQLMSLACSKPAAYHLTDFSSDCELSYDNAGLSWDFVCFLFLLIQRRIFTSYYFLHVVEDTRISMQLSARGGELFQEKLIEEVNERKRLEEESISAIKESMLRIQDRYSTLRKGMTFIRNHMDAIRAGDYYMFDDETVRRNLLHGDDLEIMDPIKMVHKAGRKQSHDEEKNSILDKMKKGLRFVGEYLLALFDSFILFLNTHNKNYRNVMLRISVEKDQLSDQQMAPRRSLSEVTIEIDEQTDKCRKQQRTPSLACDWIDLEPIDFDKDQSRLLRFFCAIWYTVVSHTDIVCYFLIILNLMLMASLLSLVLPACVLLWATLSNPRPSRKFWNFAIIYLEVIIVIKFIFQFEFFPWNKEATTNINLHKPFWPPRFIGIEQFSTWSVMELLQLLAVFFHISILKVFGVWDSEHGTHVAVDGRNDEPSTSRSADDLVEINQRNQPGNAPGRESEKKKKASFIKRCQHYAKQPCVLYRNLINQEFTPVTDVYVYMFLCDVINFIIIIFGYSAFGPYVSQSTDVVSTIQSNNVPTAFLVMLLIQFCMMVIDRGLYLKKNLVGKLIFQFLLVIGVHVWLFFILPSIDKTPFYENHVAQTWYFFKALYFLLSAYQIRAGYPKRVSGNFLTKSFGTSNLFLFKGYRAIPFLAEITAIMDWMFTATSMGIGEWMKMWSIHAEVFELKCWRVFETKYPSPRGEAKSKLFKGLVGGFLAFILFAIIWFPLLFMNIALTIGGIPNNPTQVDVKITLGTYEPLFQVVADTDNITLWTPGQYAAFSQQFAHDQEAVLFFQGFSNKQVVDVSIDGQSKTIWIISPPQRDQLQSKLCSNRTKSVRLLFEWTITKDPEAAQVLSASGSNEAKLKVGNPARQILCQGLTTGGNISSIPVEHLFPEFIHVPGRSSTAHAAKSLYNEQENLSDGFLDLDLSLQTYNNDTWWWMVREDSTSSIKMVIFSDKVSSSSFSFLVSYGIIGLYVSVVLVLGRLVRSAFIGTTTTIMFTELPYVDRILQLCLDIFLVREEEEFELEEDLFAKLLFLYRSPKILIRWTRPKLD